MNKPKRKPTWLLSVASAYCLVPGCAEERAPPSAEDEIGLLEAGTGAPPPAANPLDGGRNYLDAGLVLAPPGAPDAAHAVQLPPDGGFEADAASEEEWVGIILLAPGTR